MKGGGRSVWLFKKDVDSNDLRGSMKRVRGVAYDVKLVVFLIYLYNSDKI